MPAERGGWTVHLGAEHRPLYPPGAWRDTGVRATGAELQRRASVVELAPMWLSGLLMASSTRSAWCQPRRAGPVRLPSGALARKHESGPAGRTVLFATDDEFQACPEAPARVLRRQGAQGANAELHATISRADTHRVSDEPIRRGLPQDKWRALASLLWTTLGRHGVGLVRVAAPSPHATLSPRAREWHKTFSTSR